MHTREQNGSKYPQKVKQQIKGGIIMKRRKGLAFILALSLVLSSFSVAFATDVAEETTPVTETTTEAVAPVATATNTAFADIAGHWAKDAIVKWADYGVVKGSDGVFRPDAPLTRAEMAAILSNLMDYKVAAKNNFSDVATGAWYADAVLKANAAGVLSGDGSGLASPSANITREQATSMLARAFAVADANGTSSSLTDTQNISSWARPAVFGMEAAGYVRGFEGKFNPKNNITRAEVIAIINSAVKAYYTAAGTYTENVDGLAVVKVPGVVLKDVVISGNLIAAEGIASGDLTLDGKTEVKGKLIVRGGGENSIIIKGSAAVLSIEVSKVDGKVRIFADGALIKEITALKGEIILEGNFTNVEVKADTTVIIKGNVGTLSMESKGTVEIQSGTVTTLDIPAGATATVAANATVTTANITGAADIKGTGAIGTANISGTGATIVQTPTAVNVADGGAATVGGKTVDGATSAAPRTGGGRGNSSNTVAVSAISVKGTGDATTITTDNGTLQMVPTVTPDNASNKAVTWTVTETDGTATDKATISTTGLLTAVTNGTVTVKATSVSTGTVNGSLEITITGQLLPSTIIFANGATVSKVYGTTGYTNAVSGDGAGVVTYSSGTPATATIDTNGEVTIVGVGTTVITATKAATSTHATVTNTYTLTVTKKELTVSGLSAKYNPGATAGTGTVTIEGTPALVGIVASDGVTIAGTASGSISGSSSSETVAITGLSLAGAKAANYTLSLPTGLTVDATVVLPASEINFALGGTVYKVYGETEFTNAVTGDGAGAITYSSGVEGVATVDTNGKVTILGVGTTVITAVKAATETHATVTKTYTLTVTAKPLEGITLISGTAKVGETLTAGSVTPSEATFNYQWLICDTADGTYANIDGATNSTYKILAEDAGKYIKVVATGTGNYGETVTSEATAKVARIAITTKPIAGVTAPVTGATPVSTITETSEYTATIAWAPAASTFAASTVYTATITITAKAGYTLTGVTADFFTVVGATTVNNTPNTGVVTAVFPETGAINKSALTTAIADANTNKATATVSTDGTDVLPANKWVTSAEMGAYTTAVATAQGVADNASATQTEVNNAVTALNAATSTFNTAKKAGTKPAADTTPPVITASDKIVPIANLEAWTETVWATDDVDGSISGNVVATYFQSDGTTSLTDLAAAKEYIGDASVNTSFIIKYNVSDAVGNAATEVVVTITVTKVNIPSSVTVGSSTLNSTNPYLVGGKPATTGTLGDDMCTAHFDPITGVLSLQDYVGGVIRINDEAGKDLSIKLIGNANKITGGQFGIYNDKGDIYITSDNEASLEIEINSSSDGAAIANGWGAMTENPSVFIGGKVKLTIKAKYTGEQTTNKITGIFAGRGSVIIQDQADYSATLTNSEYQGRGISSNGKTIINTSGNIEIDVSNSLQGIGIYGNSGIEIQQVNSMLITIPSTGGTNTKFTSGTVDVSSGVAVNKSTTKASYRSGTPYTLGLEGGNITLATGEVIGSPNHQYLKDDEITIHSTISEFDRWTKADGTALETALFINSTTANSATATIKMPAESLNIKAKEKDAKISIAEIPGVTAPVTGGTPVTTPIETAQYTGTVVWNESPATFAGDTVYTATITITPKSGFTLDGVAANLFTVDGATATNTANSGVVIAVFPKTTALSSDATLTSSIGTVDNTANTIVDIPNATTLAVFKAAITPATGATFKVYQADGTTEATYLASGYKVIVTAQDITTTKTYTVTVKIGDFAGGLGTVGSPYQVSNAEQLNKVREYMGSGIYFKQTANIDLTAYLASGGAGYNEGKGWVPIGSSESSPFKGNYDGSGYTITGLTIVSTEDYQGLFGYGKQYTNLKNINLLEVNIKGKAFVGGLIGNFFFGQLENCHVSGKVEGTGDFVGGLAGLYNNSDVGKGMKNCSTSVEVIGNRYVGGLAGKSGYTTIDSCYSEGSVTGVDIVGGLVGNISSELNVKVTNSYSLASVTATTTNGRVGGLVGLNQKAIENCYAAGQVTGNGTNAGGLVGENEGTITLSYYDIDTTGQSDTGKGDGKTTAEMKQAATFTGWDTSIWNITDGSYPTLE